MLKNIPSLKSNKDTGRCRFSFSYSSVVKKNSSDQTCLLKGKEFATLIDDVEMRIPKAVIHFANEYIVDEIELKMAEEMNGNKVFWLNGDEISFRYGH